LLGSTTRAVTRAWRGYPSPGAGGGGKPLLISFQLVPAFVLLKMCTPVPEEANPSPWPLVPAYIVPGLLGSTANAEIFNPSSPLRVQTLPSAQTAGQVNSRISPQTIAFMFHLPLASHCKLPRGSRSATLRAAKKKTSPDRLEEGFKRLHVVEINGYSRADVIS